jgi:hypothetical protein
LRKRKLISLKKFFLKTKINRRENTSASQREPQLFLILNPKRSKLFPLKGTYKKVTVILWAKIIKACVQLTQQAGRNHGTDFTGSQKKYH